jgi:hypothetical protein
MLGKVTRHRRKFNSSRDQLIAPIFRLLLKVAVILVASMRFNLFFPGASPTIPPTPTTPPPTFDACKPILLYGMLHERAVCLPASRCGVCLHLGAVSAALLLSKCTRACRRRLDVTAHGCMLGTVNRSEPTAAGRGRMQRTHTPTLTVIARAPMATGHGPKTNHNENVVGRRANASDRCQKLCCGRPHRSPLGSYRPQKVQ